MNNPGDDPAADPTPNRRRNWADLGPRVASASVLIPIVAVTLYFGGYLFAVVVGGVFAGVYREWEIMVTRAPLTPLGIVLIGLVGLTGPLFLWLGILGAVGAIVLASIIAMVAHGEELLWRIGGLLLTGAVIVAVLALRGNELIGVWAGIYLATVVWMTDSAAFFTGRQIGGEKLAPDISPSKTWSGALGGLALGTSAGLIVWIIATDSPWWIGLLISAVISILGQLGDLGESAAKRHFRIKDSGDIIPGHGGLMDRLDSLTFGALFVLILGTIHAGFQAVAAGLLFW